MTKQSFAFYWCLFMAGCGAISMGKRVAELVTSYELVTWITQAFLVFLTFAMMTRLKMNLEKEPYNAR
jgi:hypothetical protein